MTDADTWSSPPEAVSTGHPDVDAAVRRLGELDGLPVDRHGEVFDDIHGRLRDALSAAASPAGEPAAGEASPAADRADG
jgi:hypothetical protein